MDRSRWSGIVTLTLVAGLLAVPGTVRGQGWIEPHRHGVPQVERVRTDVTITVDGARRLATVEVEELFRNRSGALLEGDYLYPIPAGAVFTNFSLFMGERELKGEVLNADEARRIYEEIVRRKKDPALIELVGHGVLRARVFPVEPGATRRVILRYTQVLGRDGDLLRLAYPRLVGTLPGEETTERVRRMPEPDRDRRFSLRIRVTDAELFATPYSPTHTIEVREAAGDLEITHADEGRAPRDFELFLPLRESTIGANVVAHAVPGEPGYFMLLVTPPTTPEELAIPRDVTLVLDVSGSMSGEKIEQARAALDQILAGLRTSDRFRLITFSSAVRSFRSGWSPATSEHVEEARDFLRGARAEGSTNVMGALEEALRPEPSDGRMSVVIFLTDGKPTVGETSPERIAQRVGTLRDRERVFAFGVGYDVNTYLLDRLAEGGRGAVSYVRPEQDVEVAVASLTRKLRFPALSDLRIVDAPVELEDYYPNPLPDIFYGEELVVFGRYRGQGTGELVLAGARADRERELRYRVSFPERRTDNEFIPRLWAARKAGALTAHIRLHGPDPETVEEIRQLGLRYGVLTEYTSYLVEEPTLAFGRPDAQELMTRAQDLAAAPASQTGAVAFDRAERSVRLREANKLAEAEAVIATAVGEGRRGTAIRTRQVGRRIFVLRDGVWTDLRADPELQTVRVAAYSAAYFELIRHLPALRRYLSMGEAVRIAGDRVVLEITPDGLTRPDASELQDLIRSLRTSL